MNERQKNLLELLDGLIDECKECDLHVNGKVLPYWTPISQYLIIGDAPAKNEIENGEPLVGRPGNMLWSAIEKYGLRRDDFGIINRVQCRAKKENNGKPTQIQMDYCQKWVRKFIKCLEPRAILLLGNHAKSILDGRNYGIDFENGKTRFMSENLTGRPGGIMCICSVHPSGSDIKKLDRAIQTFTAHITHIT